MLKIGKTVRFHNREGRISSISKDGTRVRVSYYHPNNGMVTHCIGADEISQEPEAGHCLRRLFATSGRHTVWWDGTQGGTTGRSAKEPIHLVYIENGNHYVLNAKGKLLSVNATSIGGACVTYVKDDRRVGEMRLGRIWEVRRTCFRTSIPGEEANALAALTGAYDRKQYWLTNLAEVI